MSYKALIVDDDLETAQEVKDILDSLGHSYDYAESVEQARECLAKGSYHYFLLDLQLPVKPKTSYPRIENGVNLLTEVRDQSDVPIIVMTGTISGKNGPEVAVDVMKLKATDYVTKPFPQTGEKTLDRKIREALIKHYGSDSPRKKVRGQRRPGQPFQGGELVCYRDRAELLGVEVIRDQGTGQAIQVLKEICQRDGKGRLVRLSREEIADAIEAERGVATVTACLHTLRTNIEKRLREALNIIVQKEDVITADPQKRVHLQDWIMVSMVDGPAHEPANPERNGHCDERQQWALDQIEKGVKLTRQAFQKRFDISEKTAKRLLGQLTQAGLLAFVRTGRNGHYECGPSSAKRRAP